VDVQGEQLRANRAVDICFGFGAQRHHGRARALLLGQAVPRLHTGHPPGARPRPRRRGGNGQGGQRMRLQIVAIADRGVPNKERLHLRAVLDLDLS
jgi:hypothetical protein